MSKMTIHYLLSKYKNFYFDVVVPEFLQSCHLIKDVIISLSLINDIILKESENIKISKFFNTFYTF